MIAERMRLQRNGPIVSVRWHVARKRWEYQGAEGDPWEDVNPDTVSSTAWAGLVAVRSAAIAEEQER